MQPPAGTSCGFAMQHLQRASKRTVAMQVNIISHPASSSIIQQVFINTVEKLCPRHVGVASVSLEHLTSI
jgi:hypothetical protein